MFTSIQMGLLLKLQKPWGGLLLFLHLLTYSSIFNFCNLCGPAAALPSNQTDRVALLAFKEEITSDPIGAFNSWNTSLHFCQWRGVVCSGRHQRVAALTLPSLGLAGRLSPHLANLSFLRFISFTNNSFHGEIPQEIGHLFRLQYLSLQKNMLEGEIPPSLCNCSQLRNVTLNYNRLVGNIPSELASLSKLTTLTLSQNNLSGTIPPSLANLTALTHLSLSYNSFHGMVPSEIGRLSQLQYLQLCTNKLSGELPPSIYNLSQILRLGFTDNQLSGSLSSHVGYAFPNLEELLFSINQFTGSIPRSLSNVSSLRAIDLIANKLTGSIPTDLAKLQHLSSLQFGSNELGGDDNGRDLDFITSLTNCSSLAVLDAEDNRLSGLLPDSIANLSTATTLYLSRNRIHGEIPSGIGNLINLQTLDLMLNLLRGPVPPDIGKLQKLAWLSLSRNDFSGQIPASFGNLTGLVDWFLSGNNFHGNIPSSLGDCRSIEILDLARNNLNGSIPVHLFDLVLMVGIDLSHNWLDGQLPSDVGKLGNTNFLDVSKNKLSGEIPTTLGNCISLTVLGLSENSFQGSIPTTLRSLKVIEQVQLSNNNLSGEIPSYFTGFKFMRLLNLSFNDLEGEVPKRGVFGNASAVSVAGNKKLCGGIPQLRLPPCHKHDEAKSSKKFPVLKVVLPVIAATVMFIVACGICACHWRKQHKREQPPDSNLKDKHLQISYAELCRATNGFSSANLIGSGTFGFVYRGILNQYLQDVAVKVINIEQTRSIKSFTAECEALREIRHRNIVKVLTSCSSIDFQNNEFKALVFKYMENGNLESWLYPHADDRDKYLSMEKRLDVAIDIAQALNYLHNECETPIIHCDLKPNNILLDDNMVAQVGDFGLAKILLANTDDSSCTSMLKGSIGYIPPEYGIGYDVTTKGDVYSYGVLLLEMLIGKRPIDDMFSNGLSISKYAQMSYKEKLMEIIDPRLLLKEEVQDDGNFQRYLHSIFKIGVTCSAELPQDRMDISVVCTELQKVRERYTTVAHLMTKEVAALCLSK